MSDKKKYEIRTSDELGRYMVASRALRAGEVVSAESPLVVGPTCDSELLCFDCHAPLAGKFVCCPACRVAPVCAARACSQRARKWHDDAECSLLASLRTRGLTPLDLVSHLAALMPLRCLVKREAEPPAWEELMRMEHHLAERRGTDIWRYHELTVEFIESLGLIKDSDEPDLVQKICGVIDVNSFELCGPARAGAGGAGSAAPPLLLRGVYPQAQLMEHDCVGNTHLSVGGDHVMVVRAAADLAPGDHILNNYIAAFQCTAERQRRLRVGKYFTCACRRCRDPTELGAHLGSVACTSCGSGLLVPPAPGNPDDAAGWRCRGCGVTCDGDEIERKVLACATKWESIDKSSENELEEFIGRVGAYLAPGHQLVLEAKQCLAGVLRARVLSAGGAAPARTLRRQLSLLADLMDVLDKLYPPISRVKAITLYELQSTSAQLARKQLQAREITPAMYKEQLAECEQLLKQAVEMLLLEPSGSPESQLCARALADLREMRTSAVPAPPARPPLRQH